MAPRQGQLTCDNCPDNSETSDQICQCRAGYYLVYQDQYAALEQYRGKGILSTTQLNESTACVPCANGANCAEKGVVMNQSVPMRGWAYDLDRSGMLFIRCVTAEACLGGDSNSSEKSAALAAGCLQGYTGPMCQVCAEVDSL